MKTQPEGTSRRGFLGSVGMAAGLAAVPLGVVPCAQSTTPAAAPALATRSRIEVRKVEQIFVDVPFKPVPAKHQYQEFDHEPAASISC